MTTDFDKVLQQQIDKLPREIAPQKDLWPGIEHSINAIPQRKTRWYPWATAAAILLSAGLMYTIWQQQWADTDDINVKGFALVLQQEHARNKQTLLIDFKGVPALASGWEEQLDALEAAETTLYTLLQRNPEDEVLLKMLQDIQSKQIDLIKSVYQSKFI